MTFKDKIAALNKAWVELFTEEEGETDVFIFAMPMEAFVARECYWLCEQIELLIATTRTRQDGGGMETEIELALRRTAIKQMLVWVYG